MRFDEIKKGQKDANGYTRCWPGKHAEGTKKGKNGGQVRNCVPNEGVAEGKDEKIAQLKKDYATAVHWSKNDTNPHKREAARQKAEKIKAHLEKQYKQGVAEGSMYGDEEVSWEKGGRRAPTGAFRNPAAEKIDQANKILDNPNSSPDMKKAAASILGQEQMLLRQYKDTAARRKQGVAEGFDYTMKDLGNDYAGFSSNHSLKHKMLKRIAPEKQQLYKDKMNNMHDTDQLLKLFHVAKQRGDIIDQQGVAEEYNPEYDDEAGMAQGSLHTLQNAVEGLQQVIDAGDNLPEWCQEKISLAEDYLVTVWDYIQSEKAQGIDPEISEEFDMIERIIESIAAHNGVDVDAVWTDLESLTEDELYAFAVTSQLNEDWSKVNKRDKTDGMSQKAVNAYRRENPGSKLKTAVTTKPSKLKKGSKASKRRKSYCSRSRGQMKMHNISCAKTPDKAICKARRRWNC